MTKIFYVSGFLLLAGCGVKGRLPPGAGASPEPLPPPISVPAEDAPESAIAANPNLVLTTPLDRTNLRRGDTVTVGMELRNLGKKAEHVEFSSGQDFDIQAFRVEKGLPAPEAAWTWSAGKMFTRTFRKVEIRPGQSVKFAATWDATSGNDRLPRGEYEIRAFTASSPRLKAPPVRVTVE